MSEKRLARLYKKKRKAFKRLKLVTRFLPEPTAHDWNDVFFVFIHQGQRIQKIERKIAIEHSMNELNTFLR